MLGKIHVILLYIVATILLFSSSTAYSEKTLSQAELISYDYMSIDERIMLWLRIHIDTPSNYEWDHPNQYSQAIRITDVNVNSTFAEKIIDHSDLLPASNAYPFNCTPDTMDNSYDDWNEFWERIFPSWSLPSLYSPTCYWSQTFDSGKTEWILEVFVEDAGQTKEDIHHFVNSLNISFQMDASYCDLDNNDVQVINGNAKHETRFSKDALQFRADSFYEESFENLSEKVAYLIDPSNKLLCSKETYLHDFYSNPEQYAIIGANVTMQKQMPWAICNVEASIVPNDTVIGILAEPIDSVYDRDRWKNGFYALEPILLVVKTGNMDEQEIKEKLKDVELYLTFSTEFAGYNDFSRTKSSGYPGVRFTVQVDTTGLLTLDEIIEKIGNISDG